MSARVFRVRASERCYRFKPDALDNHAPKGPGVYEFVAFDARMRPEILYVGAAEQTLFHALGRHLMGTARPSSEELFKVSPDIYFDYLLAAEPASAEDYRDIAAALIAKHAPRFNPPGSSPATGRYASVEIQEE